MAELSVRYATALFELSRERGALKECFDEASFLREAINTPECLQIITHPRISAVEKHAFFDDIFARHIHKDLLSLLHLTVNKGREEYLVPILTALMDMIKTHLNKITAKVISPVPLSEIQISRLTALLNRKLGKKVDINLVVKPEVIGGISVQVDGYLIDLTAGRLLKELKDNVGKGALRDAQA